MAAVTDTIADFLTRIRNAQMASHRIVDIPASNEKKKITEILYNYGYILKYKFEDTAGLYSSLIYTYEESIFDLVKEITNRLN